MKIQQKLSGLKIFLVVMLSVFALAGCTTTSTPGSSTTPTAAADATFDVEIKSANFSFTPNTLTAAPGQTLKVKVTNEESQHDFVIDELGVRTDLLSAGQSQIVSIIVPADAKPGKTYEFYCNVSNHRAMGMTGILTVK